ncbi:hypothetical protein [uncultured Tenacibaculum sp.]|uniref:hypothetical protein n=1 Tax=uncultured Tenacibaculum sp. TaxID=174713 RepID=UPI00260575D4|nr:hypothetical protein [uncultured Tenacibaculum sp.]
MNTNNNISKIKNNIQDKNSEAWKKLCEYVDLVAKKGKKEFSPREYLGDELFAQIYTLPKSISKLKKVKRVWLYGSKLKRIPPEIGQMKSLEYFDPYTSYDLKWFPYELTNCKKLKDSRISTRALFGNFKNRKAFPKLDHNPVRYDNENLKCSVCEKQISYDTTNQLWITLRIGTDTVPLLANLCSKECENSLPHPPKDYVQYPHKGGADLVQQPDEIELLDLKIAEEEKADKSTNQSIKKTLEGNSKPSLLKLVRKIWEQ